MAEFESKHSNLSHLTQTLEANVRSISKQWRLTGALSLSLALATTLGCSNKQIDRRTDTPVTTGKVDALTDEPGRAFNIPIAGYEIYQIPETSGTISSDQLHSLYQDLLFEAPDPEKRTSSAFVNTVQIARSEGPLATGTLLDTSGIVLTAAHTFKNPDTQQLKLEPATLYLPLKPKSASGKVLGFPIKSVYFHPTKDIAIVYAPTGQPPQPSRYLQLRAAEPSSNEALYAIGFTRTTLYTMRGFVDSYLSEEGRRILNNGVEYTLREAQPSGGMSGGPIVDKDGKIVGVLSGSLATPTNLERKQTITFTTVNDIPETINSSPYLLSNQ